MHSPLVLSSQTQGKFCKQRHHIALSNFPEAGGNRMAECRAHLVDFPNLLLEALQFLNESADGHVPGAIYVHTQEG